MINNYPGTLSLPIGSDDEKDIAGAVGRLRGTLKSYGIAPEAIDLLKIDISLHSLTISDDDRRTGASHVFADGKPFYSVSVSAPGSVMDLGSYEDAPLKAMPAAQQAQMLAFEIGLNLLSRTDDAVEILLKTGVQKNGGVSGGGMELVFETQTRNDPVLFIDTLRRLVSMRLDTLAPKFIPPSKDGGPKF